MNIRTAIAINTRSAPSKNKKVPRWLIWLTFSGGILVIIGGFKADIDQETSTNKIIKQTETITDLSTKIAKLTEQNIEKSEYISNTISGGDSYCYIHYGPEVSFTNNITRTLVHQGKYPIYNVNIRICDLIEFHNILQKRL